MTKPLGAPRATPVAAVLLLALVAPGVTASEPPAADAATLEMGRERFGEDCAACHGAEGRGRGPASAALTKPAPALRGLARANGGVFPEARVRAMIDGRDLPYAAHGNRDMPIWGQAYKRPLAGRGEQLVQKRLNALIAYLRAMQDE